MKVKLERGAKGVYTVRVINNPSWVSIVKEFAIDPAEKILHYRDEDGDYVNLSLDEADQAAFKAHLVTAKILYLRVRRIKRPSKKIDDLVNFVPPKITKLQFFFCFLAVYFFMCRPLSIFLTLPMLAAYVLSAEPCRSRVLRAIDQLLDDSLPVRLIAVEKEKNDEKEYADQLERLKAMGFADQKQNVKILRENDGDIQPTIAALLK